MRSFRGIFLSHCIFTSRMLHALPHTLGLHHSLHIRHSFTTIVVSEEHELSYLILGSFILIDRVLSRFLVVHLHLYHTPSIIW